MKIMITIIIMILIKENHDQDLKHDVLHHPRDPMNPEVGHLVLPDQFIFTFLSFEKQRGLTWIHT